MGLGIVEKMREGFRDLACPENAGQPVTAIPVAPLSVFRLPFHALDFIKAPQGLCDLIASLGLPAIFGILNGLRNQIQDAVAFAVDRNHREYLGSIERLTFRRYQRFDFQRFLPHRIPTGFRVTTLLNLSGYSLLKPFLPASRSRAGCESRAKNAWRLPFRRLTRHRIERRVDHVG